LPCTILVGADMDVRPSDSTEGVILVPERSVLIIDRSEETREVLKTALERRGLRILAASRIQRGVELARTHQPDLIVLDLEVDDSAPEELCAQGHPTPIVILGELRRNLPPCELGQHGQFVSKPYQYGPLIRKIEELLSAPGQPLARSA
jgi:DNA-binding response OmpR family regulator